MYLFPDGNELSRAVRLAPLREQPISVTAATSNSFVRNHPLLLGPELAKRVRLHEADRERLGGLGGQHASGLDRCRGFAKLPGCRLLRPGNDRPLRSELALRLGIRTPPPLLPALDFEGPVGQRWAESASRVSRDSTSLMGDQPICVDADEALELASRELLVSRG